VDKTFAYTGDTLTYVLSYRNFGAASGSSVSIVDALPADLFFLSSNPAAATHPAVGANGSVVFNIGTVPGLVNTAAAARTRRAPWARSPWW